MDISAGQQRVQVGIRATARGKEAGQGGEDKVPCLLFSNV